MGRLSGFNVTLRQMFKPRLTTQYPKVKRDKPERQHGRHVLNRYEDGMEKCIGCELCAGACPADAILVWGAENPKDNPISPGERYAAVYEINMLRCIFCGLCVEACPTDAITMTTFFEFTSDSRSKLVYTKEELLTPPPSIEWTKLGYVGDPIVLSQDEMDAPGVGSLTGVAGEPGGTDVDVPVVWLPTERWRGPYEAGHPHEDPVTDLAPDPAATQEPEHRE
jgi:NADH-quinone oxidoreductase chain I